MRYVTAAVSTFSVFFKSVETCDGGARRDGRNIARVKRLNAVNYYRAFTVIFSPMVSYPVASGELSFRLTVNGRLKNHRKVNSEQAAEHKLN